jgi:hypothetical protein
VVRRSSGRRSLPEGQLPEFVKSTRALTNGDRPTEGRVDRDLRRLVGRNEIDYRRVVGARFEMNDARRRTPPVEDAGRRLSRLRREVDSDRHMATHRNCQRSGDCCENIRRFSPQPNGPARPSPLQGVPRFRLLSERSLQVPDHLCAQVHRRKAGEIGALKARAIL